MMKFPISAVIAAFGIGATAGIGLVTTPAITRLVGYEVAAVRTTHYLASGNINCQATNIRMPSYRVVLVEGSLRSGYYGGSLTTVEQRDNVTIISRKAMWGEVPSPPAYAASNEVARSCTDEADRLMVMGNIVL